MPSKLAASLRQKGSETFILVLASNVIAEEEARACNDACPQRQWEEMVEFLENEIESSFPLKRWIPPKTCWENCCNVKICASVQTTECVLKKIKRSLYLVLINIQVTRLPAKCWVKKCWILSRWLEFCYPTPFPILNKISLLQALARGRVKKHVHKWRNKLTENFDILVYYFFFSRMADAESTLDLVRKMFKIFDVD